MYVCSVLLKSKSLWGVFLACRNFSFFPKVDDALGEESKGSDDCCGNASYSCGISGNDTSRRPPEDDGILHRLQRSMTNPKFPN